MKKIIIIVCLLAFVLSSCTLAPNQASSASNTATAADSSAKVKAGGAPVKAVPLTNLKRPKSITDKDINEVQKVFNNYLSGKIKMVDANKQLGAIAKRIGNVPLAWIVRNLQ
jgi:hypothetical protein